MVYGQQTACQQSCILANSFLKLFVHIELAGLRRILYPTNPKCSLISHTANTVTALLNRQY